MSIHCCDWKHAYELSAGQSNLIMLIKTMKRYDTIIYSLQPFKVPMKLKIIPAYLKDLSKYRRMAFFLLEYLLVLEKFTFLSKVMTSYVVSLKQYNTQSRISPDFKLGTRTVHQK